MKNDIHEKVVKRIQNSELHLSDYATKSEDAIRLTEIKSDFRSNYLRDSDRIVHSASFTRYINKTQVFSYSNNDHITKRIIHVYLVSRIARTIGRSLGLNEDLIEAISLGHDIGHTPLGHLGESFLNEISMKYQNKPFMHNIQGVRNYMVLENNGIGLNLSIQVLDGILCHNGEVISNIYRPVNKTKEQFLVDYERCLVDESYSKAIRPMTLEGCVVRISDVIAYIGRDIEDAIRLNVIKREDLPQETFEFIGNTNSDIVTNIVIDIIENSIDKPYIMMSDKMFKVLNKLKTFNYQNIYSKSSTKRKKAYYKELFNKLYNNCSNDLEEKNQNSDFIKYLSRMSDNYLNNTSDTQKIIDYIAGMTDSYFMKKTKNS